MTSAHRHRKQVLVFRDGDADENDLVLERAVIEVAVLRIAEGICFTPRCLLIKRGKGLIVDHIVESNVLKRAIWSVVVYEE